jgi:hypothetical protein
MAGSTGRAAGQAAGQAAGKAAGSLAKKAGKAVWKQAGRGLLAPGAPWARLIASFLGPYLWLATAVILVILLVFSLAMGIFGAMNAGWGSDSGTPTGLMTGVNESPADLRVQTAYQRLADKVNYEDLHEVQVEPWMITADGEKRTLPREPLYPQADAAPKIGPKIRSYYQQEYYLPWGTIHSVRLWWAFLKNDDTLLDNLNHMQNRGSFDAIEQKIPCAVKATTVAEELHPYFYYIRRTFVTRYIPPPGSDAKPSTDVEQVYLLVEQYTIDGWEQYLYRHITEITPYPDGSTVIRTYDKQDGEHLVVPDRYQRIRNYLDNLYHMDPSDPQADLMRLSVMEAGNGFVKHEQHVDWLIANYNPEIFASAAMIPAEYTAYIQEASQRCGIPWWFIAAVIMKESSFDPEADNGKTGHDLCFGLMQVSIDNWNNDACRFGFSPLNDKDNPKAQIMVGSYELANDLGKIDWNAPDWQEETLRGLAYYGGFRNSQGQIDQEALERCRTEYAAAIWQLAEGYENHGDRYWPVHEPHIITSPFNLADPARRIHEGVDVWAQLGDAVYSVSGGYVADIGYGDPTFGNFIVVSDTVHSYKYAHFSDLQVKLNQPVEAGVTLLGHVGMTGNTYGPHLHLEIRDLSNDAFINPLAIIGYDCLIEDRGGD